eukprot:Tamp_35617.p1 GENE.Tamp_35617~~Tamp_35617.p1  ORF type:complete len:146 (-),score=16.58 Tamp_35617:56-493(-)
MSRFRSLHRYLRYRWRAGQWNCFPQNVFSRASLAMTISPYLYPPSLCLLFSSREEEEEEEEEGLEEGGGGGGGGKLGGEGGGGAQAKAEASEARARISTEAPPRLKTPSYSPCLHLLAHVHTHRHRHGHRHAHRQGQGQGHRHKH